MNKLLRQFRKTLLLGCIYNWRLSKLPVFLDNDCSIRIYQSFVTIYKNSFYYVGIVLNAFSDLLCSKLC